MSNQNIKKICHILIYILILSLQIKEGTCDVVNKTIAYMSNHGEPVVIKRFYDGFGEINVMEWVPSRVKL